MFAWTERTVKSDPDAGALITNGIYYSHSPTMLFTFLNQQVRITSSAH